MLSERQSELLNCIIKEYVRSAKPVGSALAVKRGWFNLSPATIRNEMNELENAGFLIHLHTSGGRVPTDKAYRLFVNNLLDGQDFEPSHNQKREINSAIFTAGREPQEINKAIARILSDLSDNLVITAIDDEDDFFKAGLANLFEMPEFREFDKVFRLTSFFEEFDGIFERIEKEFFADFDDIFDNFRILIGREVPMRNIKDETVICAKYNLPRDYTGSLTLVGPTRMDYEKNISLIKYTVDQVNKLSQKI